MQPDEIRKRIADVEAQNFHAGAKWYQEKMLKTLREELRLAERTPEQKLEELRRKDALVNAQLRSNHERIAGSPYRMGPEHALIRTRTRLLAEKKETGAAIAELARATSVDVPEPEPETPPIPQPLHRPRRKVSPDIAED